jgi:hypothetical protein
VQGGRRTELGVLAPRGDGRPPAESDERKARPHRIRRLTVGAASVALLIAGGMVVRTQLGQDVAAGPGGRRAGTGFPAQTVPSNNDSTLARATAVQALLDQRGAAIERRDRRAFLATVDPHDLRFVETQLRMFDAMRAVPYRGWAYELADGPPFRLSASRQHELGQSAFAGKVTARYGIDGYDQAAATFDLYYTFTMREGRWYVAGDTDGESAGYHTQRQIWDFGPVTVVRGRRSIVLGLGNELRLLRQAKEADEAVPRVTRLWGRAWEQKVVIVVADTQGQMAALLGAPDRKYTQIAAVTRAESARPTDQVGADRIVINPVVWAKLSESGRRIVMTHEVTHVATRTATSARTPMWLSEGFADYVGYLGAGVPVEAAAGELVRDIRAEDLPAILPTDDDFTAGSDDLAATYEQAWLACRLIAHEYGEDRLLGFYRAVGTSGGGKAGLDAAFAEVLGTTSTKFAAAWRGYLVALAG